MSRIALLVLGMSSPRIFGKICEFFNDSRFCIFLHVDKKVDINWYISEINCDKDMYNLCDDRKEVFWGGFSMVEAEISLIDSALRNADISTICLISDDSAPVKCIDDIYIELITHPNRIDLIIKDQHRKWYDNFYFPDSRFTALRQMDVEIRNFTYDDIQNIKKIEEFMKVGKKNIETIYFSRQWWSLSSFKAKKIVDYIKTDKQLFDSFRYSLFPDEIFFPTLYGILYPEVEDIIKSVPMYADYDKFPVPWVYNATWELENISKTHDHLFIRKIAKNNTSIFEEVVKIFCEKI